MTNFSRKIGMALIAGITASQLMAQNISENQGWELKINRDVVKKENTGNVGIGVDNPSEKLQVAGNIRVDSLASDTYRVVIATPSGKLIPGEAIDPCKLIHRPAYCNGTLKIKSPVGGNAGNAGNGSGATGAGTNSINCPGAIVGWKTFTATGIKGKEFEHIYKCPLEGNVGIGVINPVKKLHIYTWHSPTDPTNADDGISHHSHYGIRLEDEWKDPMVNTISGNPLKSTWDVYPIVDSDNDYAQQFRIGTPDNDILTLTQEGKVGIGTLKPNATLHLKSKGVCNFFLEGDENHHSSICFGNSEVKKFAIRTSYSGNTSIPDLMTIMGYGSDKKFLFDNVKVGIGTTNMPGSYKLYVKGGILTEKVRSAVEGDADWSDYVFYDDYKLMSIPALDQYIKEDKHLPGIPSAKEVVEHGVDMVEMDAALLKKIEEFALYIIAQHKRLDAQQEEIEKLKKEIQTLKKQ